MKYVLVLITLALVSLSAACGPSNAARAGSDADGNHKVTSSPAKDPRLVLGQRISPARPRHGFTLQTNVYLVVTIGFHFGTYVQKCKQGFLSKSWCGLANV